MTGRIGITWQQVREYLLPGAAERDEGFRQEILKQSHLSLRIIGGLEVGVPILMLAANLAVIPAPLGQPNRLAPSFLIVILGLLTLGFAKTKWGAVRGRPLAGLSVWLNSAVLGWSALKLAAEVLWVEQYMLGYITLVMMGAVAAIPLRPLHTLSLGLSVDVFYLFSWIAARGFETELGARQHVFTFMIVLACTGLSAVVYRQRYSNYRVHQQALRTAEDLRGAQSRLLLSENAATMGRLAAGLSHELNTPIGALVGAVDTLVALATRRVAASPAEQQRIGEIVAEVQRSVQDSTKRLREIVARMQRFTNLDKAEIQSINMNELAGDVAALLEPRTRGKVKIELDFRPLPAIACRPQQLSAVFSNLISNALNAVGEDGRVVISTRHADSHVEIRVEDNGRGMNPEELAVIFDPGFRMSGGRVSTGNWSLFSCRQIIREHGGEIEIGSEPGKGTRVTVTLPA